LDLWFKRKRKIKVFDLKLAIAENGCHSKEGGIFKVKNLEPSWI
jgi:hypothetical protein